MRLIARCLIGFVLFGCVRKGKPEQEAYSFVQDPNAIQVNIDAPVYEFGSTFKTNYVSDYNKIASKAWVKEGTTIVARAVCGNNDYAMLVSKITSSKLSGSQFFKIRCEGEQLILEK
jgi:hypothetical protein